ncbi:conserved hypothetical protein [Frankia canadensis]|uniref:N-acetyltransferase domain-containing protein n=1 Tax=Frankia canadensis TaxID=1836972 RepID=A0A2I2KM36_9ACTN|nr:GNAT family N-acetyltransferase [Frankia canadensis]SNQ46723.1 conserved hypothetical protein [Frankia canadensis]SOU54013.1 conserved hypothetical protein [Frankia canadensis]
MGWRLTESVEEFLAAAGDFLASRPVENTVLVTVCDTLRVRGATAFGDGFPLFGWWQSGGGHVEGAFLHTPPHGLLMTAIPPRAVEPLVASWPRSRSLLGVNADERTATLFASSWRRRTAASAQVHRREHLYRLGRLAPPSPAPAGRSRVAETADRELLAAWMAAFWAETGDVAGNAAGRVDDRLEYGGLSLWDVDGVPVAMAGGTRPLGGTIRVGPVYTPARFRRRGYAAAVTAAVSRAALDAGVATILLFTDLANPASNGIYRRLGFVAVEDRVALRFAPSATLG